MGRALPGGMSGGTAFPNPSSATGATGRVDPAGGSRRTARNCAQPLDETRERALRQVSRVIDPNATRVGGVVARMHVCTGG